MSSATCIAVQTVSATPLSAVAEPGKFAVWVQGVIDADYGGRAYKLAQAIDVSLLEPQKHFWHGER
jgi:hypothetical protein